jgi:hypothetical protein
VAFACTNGGCIESPHFGPYSTQASKYKKKKKAFGEIVYAVTQQVQMNLIFTNKCLYIIVILQCQKVQNNCSMYL